MEEEDEENVLKLICNFLKRVMSAAERHGQTMSMEPQEFCFPRETSGWDEM
jgi:hypothetical protein